MNIAFTKMHGLGNDFVVIDAMNQKINLSTEQLRFLANRRLGVGCDQVLLVETAKQEGVDFRYRIFNADGGEVEQCGNGARCFARFVRDKALSNKDRIRVETNSGLIELHVEQDEQVTVDMGIPRFEPAEIPFQATQQAMSYQLQVDNETIELNVLSMGNPHAVMLVDDVDAAPVERLGPLIESHKRFPQRVNAGFMQVISAQHIKLRVYERGAGETQACGTGACAAVVAGRLRQLLSDQVRVQLPGGDLHIRWAGNNSPVMMTGPATSVFDGNIEL